MRFSPQRRAIFRHQNFKKCSETLSVLTFWLVNVLLTTAARNFSTSELQKVLRACGVLYILTCECAFRHSSVHFSDIRTSKSAPGMRCFVHFDFKMRFSPQRGGVQFFDIRTSKSAPIGSFFYILTWKCPFRHSAVQSLIFPLTTWLRARRFNRPTFRLTRHTNHWKNTACRDFSNIWRGCIFFLLTFALLHLLSADLTTLLCFSTVHIVGS